MRPCKHIFVGERDEEVELPPDGLPRFLGFRDGKPGKDGSFERVKEYGGARGEEASKMVSSTKD